ncbi:hypothetical protein M0R72_15450 [Candidatus Pacearchaeota archaeon]|jgi:hypothetical protein|nr:hypothetical protein [Candidatus Pacearchaeota archaeon]
MKIGGRVISGVNEEILVLPRADEPVIIRAKAVLDLEDFDKICPEPKPPGKLTKDGWVPMKDDVNYQKQMTQQTEKRIAYLVIKSLEPSQIEWETVDINDPRTWLNYTADFKSAGLSTVEINRIVSCVMAANALDEAKLEEARKVFLLGQRPAPEQFSGPTTEQPSSLSGEVVNGSV